MANSNPPPRHGGIAIGGDVTVHGDQIAGDQTKTVHHTEGPTLAELTALIAEIGTLLPSAELAPDQRRAINGDFKAVQAEMKQAKPEGALVSGRLKRMAETLQTAAKTGDAVQRLGLMLGQAAAMAGAAGLLF